MTAAATSANIRAIKDWYAKFDKKDLDGVVGPFADDAILAVGAGESEGYVPYGGRFVGKAQIRHYYAARFTRPGANPALTIRPLCGIMPFFQEVGRWILVSGLVKDAHADGRAIYEGTYLHVWSINSDGMIASLSIFYDAADVRE